MSVNVAERAIRLQIERRGTSVRWIRRQGDECPCVREELAGGRYYKPWHEANPTEPDCDGLGIVNVQTTRTDLKAIFCPPSDVSDFELVVTGEYLEDDHMLVADAASEMDAFESETDELTVNNGTYTLLWVRPYRDGATVLFYYGLAREMESKEPIAIGP